MRSISWHEWHQVAAIDSRTGLRSARARANAARAPREPGDGVWKATSRAGMLKRWSIIMRGCSRCGTPVVLALTVWVGGLLALGAVAAPAIFDVAGRAAGRGRPRCSRGRSSARSCAASTCSATAAGSCCSARSSLGASSARGRASSPSASASRSSCWPRRRYSGVIVSAQIAASQRGDRRRAVEPAEGDPRRVEFGRLHASVDRRCSSCRSSAGWSCCSGS